ncbi:MAG: hypothetical protein GY778_12695 [bacterium]|nr:hypothetical protein [bacterium]
MRIGKTLTLAVVIVGLCGLAAWAVQRGEGTAEAGPAYKVTPWPSNTAGRSYHEHVERYLNEMATQGWWLNSETTGQGARMMIFQRRPQS